jgi:hypothetical protein
MSDYFQFSVPGNDFAPKSAIHNMNRAEPGADRTIPVFYIDAVEDPVASASEGRPIYRDQEFVRILIAGDGKTEIIHKASDKLKQKYREQYQTWKATQQQTTIGTPLEQWPGASVSFIKTCKAMNVYSVEALASLGDAHLSNLGMGARDMQARARAWLAVAKDGAETERLAAENNRLQDQITNLQKQIQEMGARFSELQSDSPRKGR